MRRAGGCDRVVACFLSFIKKFRGSRAADLFRFRSVEPGRTSTVSSTAFPPFVSLMAIGFPRFSLQRDSNLQPRGSEGYEASTNSATGRQVHCRCALRPSFEHLENIDHFYLRQGFPHPCGVLRLKRRRCGNRHPLRRCVPCGNRQRIAERDRWLHVLV